MTPLLELRQVSKFYGTSDRPLSALENISFTIDANRPEIFTIAGESGSGKSTLADLILGFSQPSEGEIYFDGEPVQVGKSGAGAEYYQNVQAIFQDPFGVYNPFYRVQHVFDLAIRNFRLSEGPEHARQLIEEALNVVGLTGDDVLRKYPHQLSGGQRQRIMMARAYLMKPKLIVADEPVSMVDASLRATILDVMMRLRDEKGISFIYITHDLSTAFQVGDRIMMLYQGRVAEQGPASEVITQPKHPYVQLLVDSVPRPDPTQGWEGTIELPSEEADRIPHQAGCRYANRCPIKMAQCSTITPELRALPPSDRLAACFLTHDTVAES